MPKIAPDYTKSLIYKIVCKDLNIPGCYVGSTTNFTQRKGCHHARSKKDLEGDFLYKTINDNGGWANWDMVLIEKYNCGSNLELRQRERHWVETLGADLNKRKSLRTEEERKIYDADIKKIWGQENKERLRSYKAEWARNNRMKKKEQIKD